jgi:hypothetical protein
VYYTQGAAFLNLSPSEGSYQESNRWAYAVETERFSTSAVSCMPATECGPRHPGRQSLGISAANANHQHVPARWHQASRSCRVLAHRMDRLDQVSLPLNGYYSSGKYDGRGVHSKFQP